MRFAVSLAVTLAGVACGATLAQDSVPAPVPAPDRPARPRYEPPGVLVLVNGVIVEGRITETATGYMVALETGDFLIPFGRVQLTAKNRLDAYRKQRRLMSPPSPVNHYRLARWCFTHAMYEQAKTELRDALRLAPSYEPARELLKEVERITRPDEPRHLAGGPTPERTDDGYEVPDARSTAGLSPETAEEFTRRVQLLLANSCGTAGCHDAGNETPFELHRVRLGRGNARVFTERNLAAVMKYVDRDRPRSSRLLDMATRTHGGQRRPRFSGFAGDRQLELLEEWIATAAGEIGGADPEADEPIVRTAGERPASDATRPQRQPRTPGEPDLLDRILDEERPDAFDPAEFNRRKARPAQ